jgi:hypothetical protein
LHLAAAALAALSEAPASSIGSQSLQWRAGYILTALLFAEIYSYCYSQIPVLFLPISQAFALAAVALPFFAFISIGAAYHTMVPQPQKTIFLLAIFTFQIIHETIIAILAVIYMSPNCGLEEQRKRQGGEFN